MIEEIKCKQFDTKVERDVDYTPHYQLTRLADRSYQLYNHTERDAKRYTLGGILTTLAGLRGGRLLDASLTKKIASMGQFESITVSGSALALKKTASAEQTEPWEVVAINGVEYFVKTADAEADETTEDTGVKKTAALHETEHSYDVHIVAHNLNELNKIACANLGCDCYPNVANSTITITIKSPKSLDEVKQNVMKALENMNIFLPNDNVNCFSNDTCCAEKVCEPPVAPIMNNDVQLNDGEIMAIPLGTNKACIASNKETLCVYASAHYKSYDLYDSKRNKIASIRNGEATESNEPIKDEASFGTILSDYLMKQAEVGDKVEEIDNAGNVVAPGTTGVKVKTTGTDGKTTITEKEASLSDLISITAASYDDYKEKEEDQRYNEILEEKQPDEKDETEYANKNQHADNVKRWKGMREDPTSHKFVVYITETEEHVFEDLEQAVAFLTRK